MSGENPSVELAPLRGSIVIDLDNFNEGIEEVENRVESLKELFDDISLNFNLDGIDEIQSQLSDVTSDLDTLNDMDVSPEINSDSISLVLTQINSVRESIDALKDENVDFDLRIDGLTSAILAIDELKEQLDAFKDSPDVGHVELTGIAAALAKLEELRTTAEESMFEVSEGTDESSNRFKQFGGIVSGVGKKLRHFGMQGTMMFTVPVVMGLVKASEASAKFGASINLAKNEFGKANTTVLDFSNNALKGLDMSNGAALSLTDTFGLSVNALGANKVQSAELSMELTRLAQNMNLGTGGAISLQDATQALTGMLGGQDYALKSMGISLSNTELNQAALNSQYHKAFKNLTPYQQAVIETKVVQDKLNKSLGPLNKNLNSQYGATERAKGSFTELAENLGSTLTPEIIGLTHIIEKLNNWFSHLSPHSKDLVKDAIIGAAVLPPLALAIGGVSSVVDVLSGALLFLADNPIVLAIAGISGFVLWCHHLADESKKSTEETKKNFMRLNKGITVPINEASKNGKEKLGGLSRYMLKTSYESTNKTSENFKTMGKNINSDVNSTKNNVSNKWGEMAHDVTNKSNSMSSNTTQTFRGMNKGINSSVNNTTSHVVGKFADMRNNVTSTSSNMNSTTTVTFSSMCNSISNSMDRAGDWIRSQWNQSYNDTEANVNNIERSAETHFNSIENSIGNYMNRVAMHIHSGWDAAVNATGRELDNLDSEAHQKWGGLESWWSNVVKDLPNDVNNIGGELEQAGSNIINSLLSGIEGAWGDVTSWIGNALSNLASSADSEAHHIISSIDGSHATGLNYVPWDGYNATLHKGEMVLTESEANQYRNGVGVGGNTNITVNTSSSDPYEIASSVRRTLNQLANGF